MNNPDNISESLEIFRVKILKIGSEINIPDPQHWVPNIRKQSPLREYLVEQSVEGSCPGGSQRDVVYLFG